MKNKIIFGRWETISILVNSLITPLLLGFSRNMAELGGTAGWIICIYISVLALFLFYIISKLYEPFEGMDPLDLGERIGGGFGRIFVGILLLAHIGFIIPMILREFGEDMKVVAFPTSPISFVQAFFMLGMIIGAYRGIEAITRFHSIISPIILVGILIVVSGALPFFSTSNLTPVLGNGLEAILAKGSLRVASFSALIFLFLAYPYLKSHKEFKAAGFTGISIAGSLMVLLTVVYLGVLPYPNALEQFLPIYYLSRIINVGRFFQRIEPLFLVTWAAAAYLYLSIGFFFLLQVFGKTFRLDYYRPLIFPFAVIVFTISLLPPNVMAVINLENQYFRTTAWVTTFALVLALLIAARLMAKKNKGRLKT